MGALMRSLDWSTTPLGAPEGWPQSLRAAVSICLGSRFPIVLYWGPRLVTIYNDAYAPILARKHPWALGRTCEEVWAEIWEVIAPMLRSVMATGQATWSDDQLLLLERHGYAEECYFSFSFSPVRGEAGGVDGIFTAVIEHTQRVIGERRLSLLRELAGSAAEAKSDVEACERAATSLSRSGQDIPFALIYLLDAKGRSARLAAMAGLGRGGPASPGEISLDGEAASWPLTQVAVTGQAMLLTDLGDRYVDLPGGPWPVSPHSACVLPIPSAGHERLAGFLVAGVSPRRAFDDGYRAFLGLVAGHIATAVADARALEAERARAAALAEIDRAKTAFFSNVSHEFRTPLTLMLGPVEDILAKHAEHVGQENRALLEVVHRNALRLHRLVNTLLDFSRIEAGRIRAVYAPTDLAVATAELASNFRSACDRAGLTLVVDCPPLPEPVHVDVDMWEKIVLNLLSNAFKFTFEGEITVTLRPARGGVELAVRDTGTGIPAEELALVFERFHRVRDARGRTQEGTGIGLALVQELVKLHGGSVRADSAPGRGSTFTVWVPTGTAHLPADRIDGRRTPASTTLGAEPYVAEALRWLSPASATGASPDDGAGPDPLASRLPSTAPSARGQDEEAAGAPRILWADDNADMRDYVRRLLGTQYEVEAVADGAAALAAARARRPDLILADVMMPKLDGFELLRALRADPATRALPVILLSARAGEEARVEGLAAGADAYLVKPFNARELLAQVATQLDLGGFRAHLQRSENRYRGIFDMAGVSIWEEDFSAVRAALADLEAHGVRDFRRYFREHPDFVRQAIGMVRILDVNDATVRMFDAKDKRQLLSSLHQIFLPETAAVFVEELLAIVEGRRTLEAEATVRTLEGRRLDVLFTISFPPGTDKFDRVPVTLMDITPRKQVERERQEQAQVLGTLDAVGKTMTGELDVRKVLQIVTDAATGLSGAAFGAFFYNTKDERGEAYQLYTLSGAPPDACATFPMPRNTAVFGPTFRGEGVVRIDDVTRDARYGKNPPYPGMPGHLPVKSYLVVPVRARGGEVLGGLFFGHPEAGVFTARHEQIVSGIAAQAAVALDNARLYEAEQGARGQAERANRAKDEFLATLSHELRTPLNAIVGWVRLLRSGTLDQATGRRALEVIERNVNHQSKLITDLLDISRIISGKLTLELAVVDLTAIVASVVETMRPSAEAKGVVVTMELAPGAVPVDGDAERLRQVVANLLSNAVKFTPKEGRVTVRLERTDDEARLAVGDTGKGIAGEFLPHIFERFRQADATSTRAEAGLGLGLAIIRHIVELHRGRVHAESPGEGRGASFTVTLPIAAPGDGRHGEGGEASRLADETIGALDGLHVLVVDDHDDSRDLSTAILSRHGARITAAASVRGALRAARRARPDVLVCDLAMPGDDGFALIGKIRSWPGAEGRQLPALALTAYARPEDRERALAAGFDLHLAKPVEPRDLLQAVARLARGADGRGAGAAIEG
jgi:signal transduction histidine kinase/DNA-binding response OmpR family regulator